MITNRAYTTGFFGGFQNTPIDNSGVMFFTMAGQPYDQNASDYTIQNAKDNNGNYIPSVSMPASFSTALIQDLKQAVVGANPQLTIYIHGLGNNWSDAVGEMGDFGSQLQTTAGYAGLVIGFSWPSYNAIESPLLYATQWPSTGTAQTIRDNIVNSINAFTNLLVMVRTLTKALPGLNLNIICHSEGNYMLMQGMSAQAGQNKLINHVIMLAADIGNAALQLAPANNGNVNGMAIAALANDVSVYSSIYDEDLLYSNVGYLNFHNPKFPLRLGQAGIYSYLGEGLALPLPANVIGIDCSDVVNDLNIINLAQHGVIQLTQMPAATKGTYEPYIHGSYRYIPQVLQDMTAVMTGQKPVDRTAVPNTNGQGFQMNVAASARAAA
jgi:hypothetical protein